MTSKQGFYLMFYLLDQMYWEDTENDVLGGMLGAMNPDLFEGGVSADPAYWEDWQEMIAEAGIDFLIRIPLIEGVNADEENISRSATFLASLPWERKVVNLLPYHDIGKGKHDKRGTLYNPGHLPLSTPSEAVLQRCIDQFASCGITALIGG